MIISDPDAEREAGRQAYRDGEPYRWNTSREISWKMGWIDAAEAAACELRTLRARLSAPEMIKRCVCGRMNEENE